MYKGRGNKTYVVFNGRKPGIYATWVECSAQVNKFKDSVYKSFETLDEAQHAWAQYCQFQYTNTPTNTTDGWSTSYSAGTPGEEERRRQYVDHGPQDFLMEYNMQTLLHQVCACRRIQPPRYTLHSSTVYGGQNYFRYYASLATNEIGAPAVSMGRFATTEEQAREDVAVLLLRRLLASIGSKIRDYNYYNVEILEAEIEKLNSEKFELQMENSMLLQQIRLLKERST